MSFMTASDWVTMFLWEGFQVGASCMNSHATAA